MKKKWFKKMFEDGGFKKVFEDSDGLPDDYQYCQEKLIGFLNTHQLGPNDFKVLTYENTGDHDVMALTIIYYSSKELE